ncbi:MAG: hypothetical protein A2Z14_09000 [Chloroflexi bacterium RBG_16_48_8]|nr:MAG: hypothetical protein A2Z14_09000 [Chloroflexi bacterium RBG_16_48_8]
MWMKRAILLICLLCIGIFPVTSFAQTSGPVYIVQPGDTLYLIAQRFGTSVEELASINGIMDPSVIVPGSELVIPGFEGVSGVLDFHELEFGESISSLSLQLGVPPDSLIKLNRILHPGRLYIGQAVIVTSVSDEVSSPTLKVLLVEEGENKLTFAARNSVNPWDVNSLMDRLNRAWIVRNERIVVSGEETLLHGLPLPIKSVDVEPERVIQGQTLEVIITLQESVDISARMGDRQLAFHTLYENQLVSLQGVFALVHPGMYDLVIEVLDAQREESKFSHTQPIRVVDGEYYYDPVLYVPDETVDSEMIKLEDEVIYSIVNQITDERYWQGIFQFPTSYTDSFPSYFGSRRNYNNQGYNWYHTGLDLYGGVGTPIFAPASGRVVYTGFLDARGNVTYIDHGWGVFTGYLHQSAIEVTIGDWVKTGQQIGLVGATGRVTGPHLHWEIWVGGIPVDPLEWTSEEFP